MFEMKVGLIIMFNFMSGLNNLKRMKLKTKENNMENMTNFI